MLYLTFSTIELRQMCESGTFADNRLGKNVAASLRSRLADLNAAESINDLVVGNPRPHPLSENRENYVIDLADGWELHLRAANGKLPLNHDGFVDWERVNRVKVMAIASGNMEGTTSGS